EQTERAAWYVDALPEAGRGHQDPALRGSERGEQALLGTLSLHPHRGTRQAPHQPRVELAHRCNRGREDEGTTSGQSNHLGGSLRGLLQEVAGGGSREVIGDVEQTVLLVVEGRGHRELPGGDLFRHTQPASYERKPAPFLRG